jgi:hypothetical protein
MMFSSDGALAAVIRKTAGPRVIGAGRQRDIYPPRQAELAVGSLNRAPGRRRDARTADAAIAGLDGMLNEAPG